ncbi:MAG: DUF211 domain-containing protein [Acidithiobacillus sp.]
MRIRRLVLDVDKAFAQPSLFDIAAAIEKVSGVEGFNISVEEVDQETVGTLINVEGDNIDYAGRPACGHRKKWCCRAWCRGNCRR